MEKIDKSVLSAFSRSALDREKKVRVLIACRAGHAQKLSEDLKDQQVRVVQLIEELDIFVAEIKQQHLSLLQNSKHVSSVELDQDVNTQAD